jgi:hypothetical protein
MQRSPKKFKFNRNVTVIEGGWHKGHAWNVEDIETFGRLDFAQGSRNERKLAKAVGLDCNLRHPWAEHDFMQQLQDFRDDEVDGMITAFRVETNQEPTRLWSAPIRR